MSISFELTRGPSGWRIGTDRRIDLTHWDIHFEKKRIRCIPNPIDFVYMAGGAFLSFLVAIFILIGVINLQWFAMGNSQSQMQSRQPRSASPLQIATSPLDPETQPEKMTADEARQARDQLMENLLKDLSPEDQARIIKRIQDDTKASQEKFAPKRNSNFASLVAIARVLAVLPVSLLMFLGSLCLARAVRYFRDHLDIAVMQESLIVDRPKLFGGTSRRVLPLQTISAISCFARPKTRRFPRVEWCVGIVSTSSWQDCFQFIVEDLPGDARCDRPPERVRRFAEALQRMTSATADFPSPHRY